MTAVICVHMHSKPSPSHKEWVWVDGTRSLDARAVVEANLDVLKGPVPDLRCGALRFMEESMVVLCGKSLILLSI